MERLYDCQKIQKIYEPAITYENGELELLKMAIITTHTCTLRCKLCAERTPYYEKRYFPSLELLVKQIEKYFEVVSYTMKIEVSGGEPLTRRDLPEFLEVLLQYKKQFGRVRLITNGTIEMTENLVAVFQKYGTQLDVLIDCYSNGGKLLSVNAEKNAEILKAAGVSYILRKQSEEELHYNGWVDFGSLSEKRSEEETKRNFESCAIYNKVGGGFRMKNGVITPCAITQQLDDFGILPLLESESLDLFDDTLTVGEKKEKIVRMFSLSRLSSCQYCNGMCDTSERFAPAEQLVNE